MYTCRECEQPINQASELCPYCGADLTIPPPDETGAPPKKRSLARVVFLWAGVIAGLWAIAWLALPSRLFNPSTRDSEQRAREAIADVQTALSSYAGAEGNFPATLETLGDQARRAAQWAQTGGYRLLYAPAGPGPDGRVHNYTLLARPGNYGYRNFYSDATGIVRATREDRPATPQDPPI
jgi:hypothetical protein